MLNCTITTKTPDICIKFEIKIYIYFFNYCIDPHQEIVVRQLHIDDGATKGFQCFMH